MKKIVSLVALVLLQISCIEVNIDSTALVLS